MKILSGVKPTGGLHLGNYFGAIRQFLKLQEEAETFYFVADLHSLNDHPDPAALHRQTLDVFTSYIALGLDPHQSTLFIQSMVHEHAELCWILMNFTGVGLMQRAHAYKDAVTHSKPMNMGLFAYPILQAADILLYDADRVPVGADQKQHLEMTADIASHLNERYGPTLVVPEPYILDQIAVVPGTDGQKMSKSYQNTISIFAPEPLLKKQVMSIVTDSTPVDAPKDPDTCNVFALSKLFLSDAETKDLRSAYLNGGLGYGEAKKRLLECILSFFAKERSEKQYLEQHAEDMQDLIQLGTHKAQALASQTMARVKKHLGLTS